MTSLLSRVKETCQDFEWYPTTDEMIAVVANHIYGLVSNSRYCERNLSMLDIGAGDGRVLHQVDTFLRAQDEYSNGFYALSKKFAIEKSQPLIMSLADDITLIGTDFNEQTLMDKNVDVIFCNPPYSNYEDWTVRILKECNCDHVYLVIPSRWKLSDRIKSIMGFRDVEAEIIYTGDFFNAEREARAQVDILYISFVNRKNGKDPFTIWFDETFDYSQEAAEIKDEEPKEDKLARGKNQIEVLVESYMNRLAELVENYRAVSKIDRKILNELGVGKQSVMNAMRNKVTDLKKSYWENLFSHFHELTDKLTNKTRKNMLEGLQKNTGIDFTRDNAYAVVLWALKNANKYIDEQLIDLYKEMTCEDNAAAYKSNRHMTKDTWRYCRRGDDNTTHYKLEYRIVLCHWEAISRWSRHGLSDRTAGILEDIFTVANNLGFRVINDLDKRRWEYGKKEEFVYTCDGKTEIFFEIRMYKNGNIHIKFNQAFMKALNIEAGRLLGWIKSPKEASDEMGIAEKEAEALFMSNINVKNLPLLLGA